ncbi:MAG: hypothetical protein JNJ58_07770 [Chitinophagaceae bacterium]|nr:hypothetical protein [Chitinophagaceae bacterium]
MLKRLLLLSLCSFFLLPAFGQNMRKKLKKRTAEACVYGNVGYYGNAHWSLGANIHYLHGIGRKKQTFSVGMGIRANMFNTKRREYTTSSRVMTALNPGGADTLYMPKVQTNTLNGYIALKIHIKQGVDVFFSTDIGGINFGDSKDGYFQSYETEPLPPGILYKSEPYAFNLHMPWTESYGTIMSEAYGSFRINDVLYWRLGFNYLRNEYKIDRNIPMNGKRFYQNHWMVMSGLCFDIRWHRTIAQSDYQL